MVGAWKHFALKPTMPSQSKLKLLHCSYFRRWESLWWNHSRHSANRGRPAICKAFDPLRRQHRTMLWPYCHAEWNQACDKGRQHTSQLGPVFTCFLYLAPFSSMYSRGPSAAIFQVKSNKRKIAFNFEWDNDKFWNFDIWAGERGLHFGGKWSFGNA